MAEFGELKVSLTVSLDELESIVALLNFAREGMRDLGLDAPAVVEELSEMYFQLKEQLDENLLDFQPE